MSFIVNITETKVFMQVTGTASDVLIQTYIDLVESELEAVLMRKLEKATYTEVLDYKQSKFDQSGYTNLDAHHESPVFFLKNTPVIANSLSLEHGGTVPTESYTYNLNNGVLKTDSQLNTPTATYVAGYTTATAPADLKGLVNMGVASLFNNNTAAKQGSGNVQSKKIKDFSVTYGNNQNSYVQNANGQLVKTYLASNQHIINRYTNVNL